MNRLHLRGATDHKESEKRCFSVLSPCRQFRGVAFKSLGVNTQHADQQLWSSWWYRSFGQMHSYSVTW